MRFRTFDGRPLALDTRSLLQFLQRRLGALEGCAQTIARTPISNFAELRADVDPAANRQHRYPLAALEAIINFIPDMSLDIQGQYDNVSANFAFLARYRWEYEPATRSSSHLRKAPSSLARIFPGQRFEAQRSLLSIRLGHTFRF
jgi:hypothetical protein